MNTRDEMLGPKLIRFTSDDLFDVQLAFLLDIVVTEWKRQF